MWIETCKGTRVSPLVNTVEIVPVSNQFTNAVQLAYNIVQNGYLSSINFETLN